MSDRTLPLVATLVAVVIVSACSKTPDAVTGTSAAPGSADATQTAAATSTADAAPASAPAASADAIAGTVAETMDAANYTYMRLDTGKDQVWVAAAQFPVKVGDRISVIPEMPMENFHSKSLNRDFPLIYFVSSVGRDGQAPTRPTAGPAPAMMTSRGATPGQAPAKVAVTKLDPPAGGLSIADVWAKSEALSGKTVVVRGTVVKYNGEIMGMNWLHIQDGSGSADKKTNDLTITTSDTAKVGDVVTATGTLATKKDFGAGYAYDAIVEKASLKLQ